MVQAEDTKYGRCTATAKSTGERCKRAATGEHGVCNKHGGAGGSGGAREGSGAPENNDNRETHGMRADPKKYHARQPDDEQSWIFELSEVICDRIRERRGTIDPLDRVLARRVAIKMHIAAKASDYIADEGLVQAVTVTTESGSSYEREIENDLLNQLRLYDSEIVSELQSLGAVDPNDDDAAAGEAVDIIRIMADERSQAEGDDDGDGATDA